MFSLTLYYFRWHYSRAIADLLHIIGNFFWFVFTFFSIPLLLKTLFVPFHRLEEQKPSLLHLGAWAESAMVNVLMRVVGFFVRLFVIIIGLFFLVLVFVVGTSFFLMWLIAPFAGVALVGIGIATLIL